MISPLRRPQPQLHVGEAPGLARADHGAEVAGQILGVGHDVHGAEQGGGDAPHLLDLPVHADTPAVALEQAAAGGHGGVQLVGLLVLVAAVGEEDGVAGGRRRGAEERPGHVEPGADGGAPRRLGLGDRRLGARPVVGSATANERPSCGQSNLASWSPAITANVTPSSRLSAAAASFAAAILRPEPIDPLVSKMITSARSPRGRRRARRRVAGRAHGDDGIDGVDAGRQVLVLERRRRERGGLGTGRHTSSWCPGMLGFVSDSSLMGPPPVGMGARATQMLSAPPARWPSRPGARTSPPGASRRPAAAAARHQPPERLVGGRVVPQPVAAHEHQVAGIHRGGGNVGRDVVGVGPQPGRDGVAARQVERHVGGDALGHGAGRDAVVDRELLTDHASSGRASPGRRRRSPCAARTVRPPRSCRRRGCRRASSAGRCRSAPRWAAWASDTAATRSSAPANRRPPRRRGGVDRRPGRQVRVGTDRDAVGHGDHRPALGRHRQGGESSLRWCRRPRWVA